MNLRKWRWIATKEIGNYIFSQARANFRSPCKLSATFGIESVRSKIIPRVRPT